MTSRIHGALRSAGDRGASAVEYSLLVAAVAIMITAAVFGFGTALGGIFQNTGTCIAAHGIGDPAQGCPADDSDSAGKPGAVPTGG